MFLRSLIFLWPLSEIALVLATRARGSESAGRDRGSATVLWVTIVLFVTAGAFLQFVPTGRILLSPDALRIVAATLLIAGMAVRWAAILTLGRLFTVNVAIREEHRLVRSGPYRWIRHPSYTGLLVAFAGLGVAFSSWLSLATLLVPITLAVLYRIRVEEHALRGAFGAQYEEYARHTKRLVPWIY